MKTQDCVRCEDDVWKRSREITVKHTGLVLIWKRWRRKPRESRSSPEHLRAAPAVMNPCETEIAEAENMRCYFQQHIRKIFERVLFQQIDSASFQLGRAFKTALPSYFIKQNMH